MSEWSIYVLVFGSVALVMMRLDRLGKQLEAVSSEIREELATDADRKGEILREWKESQKEAAKEQRQFWIFWGIVVALALSWHFITRS
jgi:hypothetical protein